MPENTLRWRPSPTSSVRRSSLVEPSTCSQLTICAMRRSTRAKSSMEMVSASGSPPGITAGGAGGSNRSSSICGSTRCIRCLNGATVRGSAAASAQTMPACAPNSSRDAVGRSGSTGASMDRALKPASEREQMSCSAAFCAASALPMPLASTQGWAVSKAWLMRSAQAAISRMARLYSRASKAARIDSACSAYSADSAAASPA